MRNMVIRMRNFLYKGCCNNPNISENEHSPMGVAWKERMDLKVQLQPQQFWESFAPGRGYDSIVASGLGDDLPWATVNCLNHGYGPP